MLFAVVGVIPCIGQQGNPPTRTIVTIDRPPSSFRKVGQAEIRYFAESDTTEVRTEWPAYRGDTMSASMWFEFRIQGKTVTRPQFVEVNLGCSGRKELLEKIAAFELEVDGHGINLDHPTVDDIEYDLNAKRFLRAMHGSVPFDTFESLVSSKSLKVHVGGVVFELNRNSRGALRDMSKAVHE
jgi:hypothetical protein